MKKKVVPLLEEEEAAVQNMISEGGPAYPEQEEDAEEKEGNLVH